MKFALINGNKVEAIKGTKGICPNCKAELIAKCGEHKIHHWAHKGIRNCDPWWENETEWHRSWKNNYSAEWQEIPLLDEDTNETHIADVRTDDGLVIEFQHSTINPNERIAREKFYKNMVWVIDSARLKRDYPRFLVGRTNFRRTNYPGIFQVDFLDECFPSAWVGSSVPVIFDFKGNDAIEDPKDLRNHLYCFLSKKDSKDAIVAILSRRDFIDLTTTGEWSSIIKSYLDRPTQNQQVQRDQGMQNYRVRRESPYVFDKGRFIKRTRF